jgi:hypothetical protein
MIVNKRQIIRPPLNSQTGELLNIIQNTFYTQKLSPVQWIWNNNGSS